MKHLPSYLIAFLAYFILSQTACTRMQQVQGDRNVMSEQRDVSSFDAIKVEGALDVYLTQGESEAVTVKADENLLDVIRTEVSGGTLRIYPEKNIRNAKSTQVYVTLNTLRDLAVSGACDVESEGAIATEELVLTVSGASDVALKIRAESLISKFSGACDGKLSGEVGSLSLSASGACDVDAYDLLAQDCQVTSSGASDVDVHAIKTLDAVASGSSDISFQGNPEILQQKSGTASDITKR